MSDNSAAGQRARRAPMPPEVSQRIAFLRAFMIIGIVFLHVPPTMPIEAATDDAFSFVRAFFSYALFRGSVPVLTAISGYLLFRSALDQRPLELFQKKSRTLLIPLLAWNLPLFAAVYVVQRWSLVDHDFSQQLHPFDLWKLVNVTLGVTGEPVNYPLNFLRDLIVLMALAPLIGVVLRRAPWIGLAVVCVIALNNFDGLLVRRNTMAINFYVGGMAAILGWNLQRLDRLAWPAAGLLAAACTGVVLSKNTGYIEWFRLVSPFLIWPAASLVRDTAVGGFFRSLAPDAFFIFLAHAPILLVLSLLYGHAAGGMDAHSSSASYILFWLLAPPIVVAVCVVARRTISGVAPGFSRLAFGDSGA